MLHAPTWSMKSMARHWFGKLTSLRRIQSPDATHTFFAWFTAPRKVSDDVFIERAGLDAFMLVRLLRMGLIIFCVFGIFAVPILIPLNYLGQHAATGLNTWTLGNVTDTGRFWAHVVFSYLLTGLVVLYLRKEMRYYIYLRDRYMMSPGHRSKPEAFTILVTDLARRLANVEALKQAFQHVPGGVRQVSLTRKMGGIAKLTAERQKLVEKLEVAEVKLLRASAKQSSGAADAPETVERPRHRQGGLLGMEVDSIQTYSDDIHRLATRIQQQQQDSEHDLDTNNAAFIMFHQQIGGHKAAHEGPKVPGDIPQADRHVEISPDDVIWDNLNMGKPQRIARTIFANIIVIAIIIFWAIPGISFFATHL